jgi:cytochrome c oxidase assembly factor CtaG
MALLALPVAAEAHAGEPLEPHDLLTMQGWVAHPLVLVPLLAAGVMYWRGAAAGRGMRTWETQCYWAGWAVLAIALLSPLHAMGGVLFSAHMAQHELMMAVAAPLLVLGRPLIPFLWAAPPSVRRVVARPFSANAVRLIWRTVSHPFNAWWLHGGAIWLWHIPALYQASVLNELVHTVQHLFFLATALLFWWALLRSAGTRCEYGLAALYVFATGLHTSVLGALLTFAGALWYPTYAETTWAWGLTAMEDQQLGGLMMWVPGGVLYTLSGLALVATWLRQAELRQAAAFRGANHIGSSSLTAAPLEQSHRTRSVDPSCRTVRSSSHPAHHV